MVQVDSNEDASQGQREQWKVRDIFWLMTAIAAVLAYARSWGDDALRQALVYMVLVLVFAIPLGLIFKKVSDALFWSAMANLMAFVAVAGGRLPNEAVAYGWGSVGAMCGALAGIRIPKSLYFAVPVSGFVAVVMMLGTVLVLRSPITDIIQFDIVTSGIVGLLLYPFVVFLQKLEQKSEQPRIVLAAWLTLVFLLGNFLVPIVGGVQR
ncbi:MAG: hypothetical protein AAF483_00380 [Planctomycetota bacterium]